jgi:mono/diheme cytochrome c family protein
MKRSIVFALALAALAVVPARADGTKDLYTQQCTKCHGDAGKGDTKMGQRLGAKDYSDPKVQEALKDDVAFKSIKEGLVKDDKTLMKPSDGLTDDQIKALVTYMRTFKK